MSTILACIDRSKFTPLVIEHAAWAARRIAELARVMHAVPLEAPVARTSVHLLAHQNPCGTTVHPIGLQNEGEEIAHDLFDHARAILSKSGISAATTAVRSGEVPLPVRSAFAGIALAVVDKRGEGSTSARRGVGQNVGRLLAESSKLPWAHGPTPQIFMPTPIELMTELALQPFYRREGEAHLAHHQGDGPANLPTEAQADLRQVAAMLNQPRSSDDALAAYLGRLGLSSGTISSTSAAAKATAAAAPPSSAARPNAAGPSVSRATQSWVMRRFS